MSNYPAFKKIPLLFRECVITEKIDGTNALIEVGDSGSVRAGNRNRWLTPEADNLGFAAWVRENEFLLLSLGQGLHYGEWWGRGIQRGYDQTTRRFSLFNVGRYRPYGSQPESRIVKKVEVLDARIELPPCCDLVPVVARGEFSQQLVLDSLANLKVLGSYAAPGFDKPEGVVVYHEAASQSFKVLIENDHKRKG